MRWQLLSSSGSGQPARVVTGDSDWHAFLRKVAWIREHRYWGLRGCWADRS